MQDWEGASFLTVSSMFLITAAEIVALWAYLNIVKECNFNSCSLISVK